MPARSSDIGISHPTVAEWGGKYAADAGDLPPDSRQHFDVWSFHKAGDDAGSQSYFGAIPPQVIENLLWLYTDPGDGGGDAGVRHRSGMHAAWVSRPTSHPL